jgi:hypothetical protein
MFAVWPAVIKENVAPACIVDVLEITQLNKVIANWAAFSA